MNTYSSYSNDHLLRLLKENSEPAFTELYNRCWKRLYTNACRKLADKELAKEVVHDVLLDLWKRRHSLEISDLTAYVTRAVHYRVLNALVKKNDLFFFEFMDESLRSLYDADKTLMEKEFASLVSAWVEALPEKRREIFVRYYFQQLGTLEIAQQLDVSQKTVQNQLSISSQYLRSRFRHLLTVFLILNLFS